MTIDSTARPTTKPTTAGKATILRRLREATEVIRAEADSEKKAGEAGGSSAALSMPPVVTGDWISFDDPARRLIEVIESVGGSAAIVADEAQAYERLQNYAEFAAANRIWSDVPAIPGNVDLMQIPRPHDVEDVDFSIYHSRLGVAENGACWVDDEHVPHRVIFFIAQHLILLVNRSDIVNNMHQAYESLGRIDSGFGCFISGPSKTADIEQSLVIGAHGCRSLQLYILDR